MAVRPAFSFCAGPRLAAAAMRIASTALAMTALSALVKATTSVMMLVYLQSAWLGLEGRWKAKIGSVSSVLYGTRAFSSIHCESSHTEVNSGYRVLDSNAD